MAGSEAQAGFYYQNIVAALCALELIENATKLRSITLENPQKAEYIDDIIINAVDKVSFVQVKWSEDDSSAFTLYNLAKAEGGSRCRHASGIPWPARARSCCYSVYRGGRVRPFTCNH